MQDESTIDEPALDDDRVPVSAGLLPQPAAPASASTVDDALSAATQPDRILHSDPHDFAGLYIRHRSSFTLHARRYLRDGRDADEVVQEAFLRLFLALPELETELQALAYCRRTITNLCIDRYRAQARRPSLVDLDSVSPEELADDDPGDPVVRAEDAAIVREAMSMLSPLHRAALVKREIEEKPLPLIAEELDIPEDSVKHLLFRARRALRRLLATTSLAPGSDSELANGLGRAAKVGSGGMAGFLLVLALGLGTGPDLRAIPVVGTDLPDLIPVTSPATDKAADVATNVATGVAGGVAKAVNAAVTQVTGAVKSVTTDTGTTGGIVDGGRGGPAGERSDPLPAPSPSPSRTPGSIAPSLPSSQPLGPPIGRTGGPETGLSGGQVGPSVSPTPGSGPNASASPSDKSTADKSTADKSVSDKESPGASPSAGGKATPSSRPSPDAASDASSSEPAAPAPPAEVPVASPETVPAAAEETTPESAPGAVEPQTKAERKAAKKLNRQSGSRLKLTRPAPVVVLSPTPAEASSPTSTDLPVAP